MRLFENPNNDSFTHELGHVLDQRSRVTGDALEVTDSLRTIFKNQRPRFNYESATGDLPAEYVAETFREAMSVVRSPTDIQERNLQQSEKKFPGITLWYNWIKARLTQAVATQL